MSLGKDEMLAELRDCLIQSRSLLKTAEFDFYIDQFEVLEIKDFATTKYGVELVRNSLARKDLNLNDSRRGLIFEISMASINLLTYTSDDICSMQTEFHWYFCKDGNFAYKQSEMGVIVSPNGKEINGTSRVAKASELPPEFLTNLI